MDKRGECYEDVSGGCGKDLKNSHIEGDILTISRARYYLLQAQDLVYPPNFFL
jgi:hypothetical protein